MNQQTESGPKTAQNRDEITLFTVKAFALKSGIPYRAILTAIAAGELRCLRRNKRWFRIRSEDAARWVVGMMSNTTKHN